MQLQPDIAGKEKAEAFKHAHESREVEISKPRVLLLDSYMNVFSKSKIATHNSASCAVYVFFSWCAHEWSSLQCQTDAKASKKT